MTVCSNKVEQREEQKVFPVGPEKVGRLFPRIRNLIYSFCRGYEIWIKFHGERKKEVENLIYSVFMAHIDVFSRRNKLQTIASGDGPGVVNRTHTFHEEELGSNPRDNHL